MIIPWCCVHSMKKMIYYNVILSHNVKSLPLTYISDANGFIYYLLLLFTSYTSVLF